jgi:hypothetical protein
VQRYLPVTPAKGGVQKVLKSLDSGFRRNDAEKSFMASALPNRDTTTFAE